MSFRRTAPDHGPPGHGDRQPSGQENSETQPMADTKIPVFMSFDYDHDATLKEFLVGADSDGFRTPVPIDSVQRFRSFRTP